MAYTLDDILKDSYVPSESLMCLVLGKRAGGKSYFCGTSGNKTLMLTFSQENHGAHAASIEGAENLVVRLCNVCPKTKTVWEPEKDADRVFENVIAILQTPGLEKHFKTVCFDGFSALDRYAYYHSKVLAANQYTQGKMITECHFKVVSALKVLAEKNVDIIATCALAARLDEHGDEILEPSMRGTKTVESIAGEFSEIVGIGKIVINGSEKEQHVLQFDGLTIQKEGSVLKMDKNNKPVKGGSRIVSVDTRVTGVPTNELPEAISANIVELKALKKTLGVKRGAKKG